MPGGANQATCTLQYDPSLRHEAFQVGRRFCVLVGGSVQWEGVLQEPVPGDGGWSLTADGAGTWGSRFRAVYTSPWIASTANDVIDQAITRGLRWVRGSVSGGDLSQPQDSASISVADFMNQITSVQSTTWRVTRANSGLTVNLITIPSTVTRLLITTVPASRTVAGLVNALFARYEASADASGAAASFGVTSATNPTSIAAHDRYEDFWDLTSAGVLTSGAANALAVNAIGKYQGASFGNAFTVQRGQYLTVGGAPVDLACEHAGEVVKVLFAAGSYGGQLLPGSVTFPVGSVSYDADSDQLAVTAYQTWRNTLSDVLTVLAPKAPA